MTKRKNRLKTLKTLREAERVLKLVKNFGGKEALEILEGTIPTAIAEVETLLNYLKSQINQK